MCIYILYRTGFMCSFCFNTVNHRWHCSDLDNGGKRCMVTEPLTGPFLQTIQYDGIITEYLEWRS